MFGFVTEELAKAYRGYLHELYRWFVRTNLNLLTYVLWLRSLPFQTGLWTLFGPLASVKVEFILWILILCGLSCGITALL